jgi:Tol biopolymer transport system component/DNA-binding winged helix-turn-helix (wHTH) protein
MNESAPVTIQPWMEPSAFRLGDWLVEPELNRISNGSGPVQVEPRVMGVLTALAACPGQVVTRRALLRGVWTDSVVCEEALTRAISRLRALLKDDPAQPRYIETIRKGGYRLVAEVVPVERPRPQSAATVAREMIPPRPAAVGSSRRRFPWIAGAVVLAVAALLLLVLQDGERVVPDRLYLQSAPLTTYPGVESHPALSPGGSMVAFVGQDETGAFDLYVKQIGEDTRLRLTSDEADEAFPAWSPDGSQLAFVTRGDGGDVLCSVPILGGAVRCLYRAPGRIQGVDWSPDASRLVFAAAPAPGLPTRLLSYVLQTGEVATVPIARDLEGDVTLPACSPDGGWIAFLHDDPGGPGEICLAATTDGEVRILTGNYETITGLDWDGPGRALVFATTTMGRSSLWRLDPASGFRQQLVTAGRQVARPAIASGTGALAYEELNFTYDVWSVDLGDDADGPAVARPLVGSTQQDYTACYAPDGRRLAFLSSRTGQLEIWICDADGGHPARLSRFGGDRVSGMRWAPDGRHIACTVVSDSRSAVHLVDVETGIARKLHDATWNERFSSWSRDGRWLYYNCDRDGGWQVWRMRPDGAEEGPVTVDGGLWALEAPWGEDLLLAKPGSDGLWARPLGGGEDRLLLGPVDMAGWTGMAVAEEGVYFLTSRHGQSRLSFRDWTSGRVRDILDLEGHVGYHLALSPDGRHLVLDCSRNYEQDLMLVSVLP